MNVQLLQHTPEPELTVAIAARLCYSDSDISDLKDNAEPEKDRQLIRKVMGMGHTSVAEHVSFTFGVEGISRVTSHQLVRHRIGASYSQQSQRYVDSGNNFMVIPPSILDSMDAYTVYAAALRQAQDAYTKLTELGIPPEDARYLLPNATETKIIITMNARELLHFFKHRCCDRAQWEIRAMANKMLQLCKQAAPTLFETAGAACVSGPCPEGPMTCGKRHSAPKA